MTTHRGRWTLADRADAVLRELPVTVPPGTAALTVRLDHPRDAGVLDLGCLGPAGFRGWSGGARDTFTITAGWATPATFPASWSPASGGCCCGCTGSRPRGSTTR